MYKFTLKRVNKRLKNCFYKLRTVIPVKRFVYINYILTNVVQTAVWNGARIHSIFNRSNMAVYFQHTFVEIIVSVVWITNASIIWGGVMDSLTVQMDRMRKIAVVRMVFIFFKVYLMFKWNGSDLVILRANKPKHVTSCYHLRTMSFYQLQIMLWTTMLSHDNNVFKCGIIWPSIWHKVANNGRPPC